MQVCAEDSVVKKPVTKTKPVKPRVSKRKAPAIATSRGAAIATLADVPEAVLPEVIASAPAPSLRSRQWILDTLHEVIAKSMRGETGFNGSSANAALKLLGQEEGMFVELKRMSIDPLDGLTREEMKQLNDYLDRIAARLDFKSVAASGGGAAQPGQDPA
jgi:hypothetical protein